MKLPHITVEYREEESFALGKMSAALIFGLGIHWTWVYLVMFNSDHLFASMQFEQKIVVFGVSLAVFALTLLAYGVFLEPMRKLFATARHRRRNRLIATCLVFFGTLLFFVAGQPGIIGWIATVCAGVLTGAGSAVLFMSYGVSFSVCDIATASISTALSLTIGVILFVFVLAIDSMAHPLGVVFCLAIPIGEFFCLSKCSHQLVDNLEFTTSTLAVHACPFALHVCIPCLVFGVFLGMLRFHAIGYNFASSDASALAAPVAFSGIACFVLVVAAMLTQRQSNNFMFRTLLPVVAVLIAAAALLPQPSPAFVTFALFTAYLLLEGCIWLFCADISQRFRISAFTVYGFGRGSLAVGAFISFGLMLPYSAVSDALRSTTTLAVVALAALTLGMALLPKNAELRRTLKVGRYCPALQGDEQFALITDDEFEDLSNAVSPDVTSEQTPGTSAKTPRAAEPEEELSPTQLESVPTDTPREEIASALDSAEEIVVAEENKQRNAGRFKRKCAAVAETYLLSRKETEVLFLLAKGRNAATIQEQLFISAGTANTHMRHIYRKLNVHSQQELIALVEETEVEDIDL